MSNVRHMVSVRHQSKRGFGVLIEGIAVRWMWDEELAEAAAADYRKYPADARRALVQHAKQLMAAADELLALEGTAAAHRRAGELFQDAKAAVNAAHTVLMCGERP